MHACHALISAKYDTAMVNDAGNSLSLQVQLCCWTELLTLKDVLLTGLGTTNMVKLVFSEMLMR